MSTYMPKAADIERKWYVLDAEGKPLGRVAAVAADLLRRQAQDHICSPSRLQEIMLSSSTPTRLC